MSNLNANARNKLTQFSSNQFQTIYTVMNIVDSTATTQFSFQSFLNHSVIIFCHESFYWQSIFRRSFNNAHIPTIDKRHVQSTRNGRSRKSKHINTSTPLFNFFFLGNTKALLFIYDKKSQIREQNICL